MAAYKHIVRKFNLYICCILYFAYMTIIKNHFYIACEKKTCKHFMTLLARWLILWNIFGSFTIKISSSCTRFDNQFLYKQIQSRIVGGQQDNLNQFPWHASLQVSYNNNPTINNCGGSIISTTFILTSADCVLNAKSIKINMGSSSFSKPGKTLTSTTYAVHPQFNTLNFQNNIALVKLPSALVWTATISAIRLVARSQGNASFYNNEAYLTGFGRTQTSKIPL